MVKTLSGLTNFSVSDTLKVKKVSANNSLGTAGQVLTTNGTATYWDTPTAEAEVNTALQYVWTNTNIFNANVTVNAALIANGSPGTSGHVLHSNGSAVYWAADDVNLNTTYDLLAIANTETNKGIIRLKDVNNANDDVYVTGAGGVVVSSNASHILITGQSGDITGVSAGDGLTGTTTSGEALISVLANTGIIANTTGTYVDQAYQFNWTNNHTWNKHLAIGNNANVDFINATSAATAGIAGKLVVSVQENISGDLSNNQYYGISSRNQYTHTGANSASMFDVLSFAIASNTSTGPIGSMYGTYSRAYNYGFGTIGTLSASFNNTTHSGSNTVTSLIGSYNFAQSNGSGATTSLYGSWNVARNAGTNNVTNMFGLIVADTLTNTGNVGTHYGVRVYSPTASNTGKITTANYGIFIDDQNWTAVGAGALHYNLYSQGANTYNFFAGSVGVGNTTPNSKMHIQAATSGDGGTSNGTGSVLYVKQDTSWTANQQWALYVSGYSYLNGFRINADDGVRALYKTSAGGQLGFATAGDDPITFTQSISSERMRIAAGGNVGIGTTSPDSKLHIRVGYSNTVVKALTIQNPYDGTDIGGSSLLFKNFYNNALISAYSSPFTGQGGTLQIQTYNSETVLNTGIVLSSGGNLGVANTAPTHRLSVNGTSYFQANVTLNAALIANGGAGSAGQVLHSNGTATYWAADDNTNTTYDLLTVANTEANKAIIRLQDSGNANDDIFIIGANGITTTSNSSGAYAYAVGSSTVTVNTSGIHVNPDLTIANLTASYANVTNDLYVGRNVAIQGNLTIYGTATSLQGNTITFSDNMLYLNQGISANITAISGNGTYVTFTANNNYQTGWDVVVTGVNPTSYNGTYQNIFSANATHFVVANTNTASYVSGGTARGKTDQNPDLGIAAGYNDGTYHHTGIFRDASDGYWKVFDGYLPEPDANINIDTSNASFNVAGFWAGNIRLGNTSVYSTINSTSFSGTSNVATYVTTASTTNTFTVGTGTYFVSNGNVGIGTSSPSYKLHVNGNFAVSNTSTSTGITFTTIDGGGYPVLNLVRSDNSGRFFIDTPTDFAFQKQIIVSGNVLIGSESGVYGNGTGSLTVGSGDNNFLRFGVKPGGVFTEVARITNTANFGIGTSVPSEKLHVQGNALVTSNSFTGPNTAFGIQIHRSGNINYIRSNGGIGTAELQIGSDNNSTTKVYAHNGGVFLQPGAYHGSNDYRFTAGTFTKQLMDSVFTGTDHSKIDYTFTNNISGNISSKIVHSINEKGNWVNYLTAESVNGYVGIGTTAPSEKLHVYGSTSIFLKAHSTTNQGAGLWAENSSGWYKWQIDSTRAFSLTDSAGPNRMFVANNGNIGLGDFAVSTSGAAYAPKAKLDVAGALSVGYALTDTFTTPSNSLVVSGNIGVGITSPALQSGGTGVHISGTSYSEIKFTNGTTGNLSTDGTALVTNGLAFAINNREAGEMTFGTSNLERMRISAAGDVGVGTTAPISRFTIVDSTAKNGTITLGDDVSYHGKLQYIFSTGEFRLSQVGGASLGTTFYTNGAERVRIDATGNVGIGTVSPSYKLDVVGTVRVKNGTVGYILGPSGELLAGEDSGGYYFAQGFGVNPAIPISYGSNGTTYQRWFANGSERVRLTSAGNIGIGTTSPAQKLQVEGWGRFGLAGNDAGIEFEGGYGKIYRATATGNIVIVPQYHTQIVGNLGIGISSPSAKVHTYDNINGAAEALRFQNANTGSDAHSIVRFYNDVSQAGFYFNSSTRSTDVGTNGFGFYNDATGGNLQFRTQGDILLQTAGANERVRIVSNGNVGIGNSAPAHRLSVNGTSYFQANVTINSALIANGGAGSAGQVLHSNGTATYWAADDNTNTTYDLLTVANSAANEARIRLKDSANANDDILIVGANGITTFSNSTAGYAFAVGSSTVSVNTSGIHVNPILSITDLTVSGNLSVLGDTVTLNVASIAIEDSLVEYSRNQNDTATFTDALDIGFYGSYGNTANSWSTGLFRDQSDSGIWKIFQSNGTVTNTNIDTANSSLFRLAPLEAASFGTTEAGYGSATGGAIANATLVAVGNSTVNTAVSYGQSLFARPIASADFDAINIAYSGSWSTAQNFVAGINVTDSSSNLTKTVGRFGITFNSQSVGAFVVKNLYNAGYTNTSTVFTATGAGNVGISTASPERTLDVNGNVLIRSENSNALSTRFIAGKQSPGTGTGSLYLQYGIADFVQIGNGTTQSNFYVANGNVGIGNTAPAAKLHVQGTSLFRNAGAAVTLDSGAAVDARMEFLYNGTRSGLISVDSAVFSVTANSAAVLTLGANAQERMRIAANGNVGIRNSSPSTILTVNAKVADDNTATYDSNTVYITHQTPTSTTVLNDPKPILLLARQGTGGQAYGAAAEFNLSRYENNGVNSRSRLDIRLAHASFLDAANTTVMTMRSDGNVGIGTITPGVKLDINGNARIANGSSLYWLNYNSTTNGPSITGSNDSLNLEAGPVGSGRGALSLTGHNNTTLQTDAGYLTLSASQSGTGEARIMFSTAGSERMRIDHTGKVGIGTINPLAKVHVALTGASTASITTVSNFGTNGIFSLGSISNNSEGVYLGTGYNDTGVNGGIASGLGFFREASGWNTALAFYTNGTTDSVTTNRITERMRINSSGNVGIGTTAPSARLQVSGATQLQSPTAGSGNGGALLLTNTDVNYGWLFGVASNGNVWAQAQRVDGGTSVYNMTLQPSGGNVGIGTVSPTAKLHIIDTTNTSYPLKIENTSTTANANLLGLYTDAAVQRLQIYYDRTNDAVEYRSFDDGQRFYTGGSIIANNSSFLFKSEGRTENIAGRQYGIRVENGGARYTDQTALYATNTDTVGNYATNYRGVHGVTLFSTQAGGSTEAIFGETTIDNWNYQGRHCSVRGVAIGGGTTFSNSYGLTQGNGAFGGHFVAYGKSDVVGVYADAYHLASPGAGAQAVPLVVASNGTFLLRVTSTGQLAFQTAGTAAAPVVSKFDDLNTGMFFPAADTIAFSEGGTEAMRIDSAGNVGIGSSSPVAKLEVKAATDNQDPIFQVTEYRAGGAALAKIYESQDAGVMSIGYYGLTGSRVDINGGTSGGGSNIYMYNGASANVVITSSGNSYFTGGRVGIGTANPNSPLHVNGDIFAEDGVEAQAVFAWGSPHAYTTGSGLTAGLMMDYASNVGNIRAFNNSSGTGTAAIGFITAGSERMRVTASGDIGIGTTSPGYKLQVNGSFAATTKSFVIDHPTKPNHKLRYGSLESPYHGVRLTGEAEVVDGICTVKLPDYIHALCHQEGAQVQLTNIKHGKVLWVDEIDIDNNEFTVATETNGNYKFYWSFTAIRKDIEEMIVEFEDNKKE